MDVQSEPDAPREAKDGSLPPGHSPDVRGDAVQTVRATPAQQCARLSIIFTACRAH